jgi:hypothetical protein
MVGDCQGGMPCWQTYLNWTVASILATARSGRREASSRATLKFYDWNEILS